MKKTYGILVKTSPSDAWIKPVGWQGFADLAEARRALVKAKAQWCKAKLWHSDGERRI